MKENFICEKDDILGKISKIYVINLKSSSDRLERVSKSLNEIGINFERFEAINGLEVEIQDKETKKKITGWDIKNNNAFLEIDHKYTIICNPENSDPLKFNYLHKDLNYQFSVGYLGIYCSNFIISQEIVKNKYQYTIIFEDDIEIKANNFTEKLENFISNLPHSFDLGYLGVYNEIEEQIAVSEYVNKFIDKANFFCRMGVVESYKAAEKFLSTELFWGSFDHYIRANAVYMNIPNTDVKRLETYVSPELQGDISVFSQTSDIESMK